SQWIELSVAAIIQGHGQALNPCQGGIDASGRLPHAPLRVCSRHYPGDNPARHEFIELSLTQWVGFDDEWKIHCGIAGIRACESYPCHARLGRIWRIPC